MNDEHPILLWISDHAIITLPLLAWSIPALLAMWTYWSAPMKLPNWVPIMRDIQKLMMSLELIKLIGLLLFAFDFYIPTEVNTDRNSVLTSDDGTGSGSATVATATAATAAAAQEPNTTVLSMFFSLLVVTRLSFIVEVTTLWIAHRQLTKTLAVDIASHTAATCVLLHQLMQSANKEPNLTFWVSVTLCWESVASLACFLRHSQHTVLLELVVDKLRFRTACKSNSRSSRPSKAARQQFEVHYRQRREGIVWTTYLIYMSRSIMWMFVCAFLCWQLAGSSNRAQHAFLIAASLAKGIFDGVHSTLDDNNNSNSSSSSNGNGNGNGNDKRSKTQ